MSFVGLISATDRECRLILENLRKDKTGGIYSGKIGGSNIALIVSGMGKANASHAATILIEGVSPSILINFGIGGAYPSSGLGIGDIAIADKEIYGDEGLLLKDGFHPADSIGIPLLQKRGKKYFNEFPVDKKLTKKTILFLKQAAVSQPLTPLIKSGAFVTVSSATGTSKRAKELEKRFNAVCESMEGAAVAHICAMYGIRFLEIRGISNIVEKRDKKKWDIKPASENCQKAVLELLKKWG